MFSVAGVRLLLILCRRDASVWGGRGWACEHGADSKQWPQDPGWSDVASDRVLVCWCAGVLVHVAGISPRSQPTCLAWHLMTSISLTLIWWWPMMTTALIDSLSSSHPSYCTRHQSVIQTSYSVLIPLPSRVSRVQRIASVKRNLVSFVWHER